MIGSRQTSHGSQQSRRTSWSALSGTTARNSVDLEGRSYQHEVKGLDNFIKLKDTRPNPSILTADFDLAWKERMNPAFQEKLKEILDKTVTKVSGKDGDVLAGESVEASKPERALGGSAAETNTDVVA
jgi:hypothetical protein